jgi:hypothetical protein
MSETAGIDFEYSPIQNSMDTHENESLTAALFQYLQDKGITVYKSNYPVILHEDQSIEMMSRKMVIDCPMIEAFEELYRNLETNNIDTVYLYMFRQQYVWTREMDAAYQPVGEPRLVEYRVVRYGVRR